MKKFGERFGENDTENATENATEKATENLDSIQANGRCDPNEIWG